MQPQLSSLHGAAKQAWQTTPQNHLGILLSPGLELHIAKKIFPARRGPLFEWPLNRDFTNLQSGIRIRISILASIDRAITFRLKRTIVLHQSIYKLNGLPFSRFDIVIADQMFFRSPDDGISTIDSHGDWLVTLDRSDANRATISSRRSAQSGKVDKISGAVIRLKDHQTRFSSSEHLSKLAVIQVPQMIPLIIQIGDVIDKLGLLVWSQYRINHRISSIKVSPHSLG